MNQDHMNVLGAARGVWLAFQIIELGFDMDEVVIIFGQGDDCSGLCELFDFLQLFVVDGVFVGEGKDEECFSAIVQAVNDCAGCV